MYFSCFAKKSTKRRRLKRTLKAALPRVTVAPLKNHPDAHYCAAEYLNGQNFQFVALYLYSGGSALAALPIIERWSSRKNRNIFSGTVCRCDHQQTWRCATGEVHRRGRLGSRERDTQRLSYAAFFGYFLGGADYHCKCNTLKTIK